MPNPETKELIAVDVDDVIFPLVTDLVQYLDKEHKVRLTTEDFVEYDIRKIWKDGPEEATRIFEIYKHHPERIEVAPLKGAKEALGKLALIYDIIVLTARDIEAKDRTNAWIRRHFPDVFKDVHLVGNRRDSLNWRPKDEVCLELGVNYLIEDNLKTALRAHSAGIQTFLFGNYPWNRIDELPDGMIRVKDWQEVLEYFEREQSR